MFLNVTLSEHCTGILAPTFRNPHPCVKQTLLDAICASKRQIRGDHTHMTSAKFLDFLTPLSAFGTDLQY